MTATDRLLKLDSCKSIVEFSPNEHQFADTELACHQPPWGPSGISTEEGELLYSLIRITRPEFVLETGTNVGYSTSYICLALQDNKFGRITSVEHSPYVSSLAKGKLEKMGFSNFDLVVGTIEAYKEPDRIDFCFLDTELNIRYGELLRFFPKVKPGGLICIHDLPLLEHPGFGGVPAQMQSLIDSGQLRYILFPTIHGLAVFQKAI